MVVGNRSTQTKIKNPCHYVYWLGKFIHALNWHKNNEANKCNMNSVKDKLT